MSPAAIDRAASVLGERARRDEPLGALTTYRVGGSARLLVEVDAPDDLAIVHQAVGASGIDVLVVGLGSNLLVADAGFDGLAVLLGPGFAEIDVDGLSVVAGAAARLPVVARTTVRAGLTGLEWAVGVPGSVGGAVRMNAGGHGSDMAATLQSIRAFDLVTGEDERVPVGALDLGYRRSSIRTSQVVLHAVFELRPGDRERGEAELGEIVRWRREHQPGGTNAGSVFTNPPGDSAGRLVETAGLKGFRFGTAAVSDKHANFIQTDQDGSADDVFALMDAVRHRVRDVHGIDLEPETRLVGFGPEIDRR